MVYAVTRMRRPKVAGYYCEYVEVVSKRKSLRYLVTEQMAEIAASIVSRPKERTQNMQNVKTKTPLLCEDTPNVAFVLLFALLLVDRTLRSVGQRPKYLLMLTQPTRSLHKAVLATWIGLQASCSGPVAGARGPHSRR